MKRTISLLLCAAVVLGILPAASTSLTAFAASYSGECGENVTWRLDIGTGILMISGTGDMTSYDSENPPWYRYKSSVTSIVIGDSVSSIGNYAFRSCTELTDVDISKSVTTIGSHAFSRCGSLSEVTIPGNVTIIGSSAFSYCTGLTSIVIPESVTEIDDTAFAECGKVTIKCFSGSEAHRFAVRNNIPYELLMIETDIEAVAGSGAVIDHDAHIISGIRPNLPNLDSFIVPCGGAVLEYSADIIGTGTVVTAIKGGNVISSYTVILYGDIDGNGSCDGSDAFILSLISSGVLGTDMLTPAQLTAADADHDGGISEADILLLEQAGLLLASIEQTLPHEETVSNRAYTWFSGTSGPLPDIETSERSESSADNKAGSGAEINIFFLIIEYFQNIVYRMFQAIQNAIISETASPLPA